MQSKRSEFQELKLKDLPKRMNSEDKDSCCWFYFMIEFNRATALNTNIKMEGAQPD